MEKNVYDFIQSINNKKDNELSFLLQNLVEFLFPNVCKNYVVYCYKNVGYEKGDICIRVRSKIKDVSIKMGHKNSVHCESIKKFIKFLKTNSVNQNIITEIFKFQYADGTINNTGKV